MSKESINQDDVLKAIAEFDVLGRDAFLNKYNMGKAKSYFLHHAGTRYDSKAILAAAHGHHPGLTPLKSSDFSGGESDAVKYLRRLGFIVPPPREPTWTRDELILACDLVRENGWKSMRAPDPRVVELSNLLQRLPIHPMEMRGPKFRNPNGVGRKTSDIATHHPDYAGTPTNAGATDLEVLKDFLEHPEEMHNAAELIREGVATGSLIDVTESVNDLDNLEDYDGAPEGQLLARKHFARERDKGLREKKIKQHLRTHTALACSTCGFDFKAAYGERGEGFIECHHVVPLHVSGEVKTKLSDLILICANCHRMVHRYQPWLTPDQLRALIATT
jgi:5-methylcytosine-specific restriction protein A